MSARRRKRTYWQPMRVVDEQDRQALHTWFNGLSDGMTPYKAEVLCDVETDAEKKLRAFMLDKRGKRFEYTRSLTNKRREYCITQRRIAVPEAQHKR